MSTIQAPARLTPRTTSATVIVIRNEYSSRLLPVRSVADRRGRFLNKLSRGRAPPPPFADGQKLRGGPYVLRRTQPTASPSWASRRRTQCSSSQGHRLVRLALSLVRYWRNICSLREILVNASKAVRPPANLAEMKLGVTPMSCVERACNSVHEVGVRYGTKVVSDCIALILLTAIFALVVYGLMVSYGFIGV